MAVTLHVAPRDDARGGYPLKLLEPGGQDTSGLLLSTALAWRRFRRTGAYLLGP